MRKTHPPFPHFGPQSPVHRVRMDSKFSMALGDENGGF